MPRPMLTQSQCSEISASVDTILSANPRGNGELHAYATRFVHPVLSRQFPEIPALSLRVAGLMALLKPIGGGPPPPILHHDLDNRVEWILNATRSTPLNPAELETQVAIAYGCGWRRSARNVRQPQWDAVHWADAVRELVIPAKKHISRVCRRLETDVPGFRLPGHLDVEMLGNYAVGVFVGMRPTTTRVYHHLQSIHNWNPMMGSLYGWLLRAIDGFGTVKGNLQVNRFRNGILYPVLEDDGLLAIGRVAYRECADCTTRTEYDTAGSCRSCRHGASGKQSFIVDNVRLIWPPAYITITFRKCRRPKCKTYVRGTQTHCPRCGGNLSPRLTHLYVHRYLIEEDTPQTP